MRGDWEWAWPGRRGRGLVFGMGACPDEAPPPLPDPPQEVWLEAPPPNATFRAGARLRLLCHARGGHPAPRLVWTRVRDPKRTPKGPMGPLWDPNGTPKGPPMGPPMGPRMGPPNITPMGPQKDPKETPKDPQWEPPIRPPIKTPMGP